MTYQETDHLQRSTNWTKDNQPTATNTPTTVPTPHMVSYRDKVQPPTDSVPDLTSTFNSQLNLEPENVNPATTLTSYLYQPKIKTTSTSLGEQLLSSNY